MTFSLLVLLTHFTAYWIAFDDATKEQVVVNGEDCVVSLLPFDFHSLCTLGPYNCKISLLRGDDFGRELTEEAVRRSLREDNPFYVDIPDEYKSRFILSSLCDDTDEVPYECDGITFLKKILKLMKTES